VFLTGNQKIFVPNAWGNAYEDWLSRVSHLCGFFALSASIFYNVFTTIFYAAIRNCIETHRVHTLHWGNETEQGSTIWTGGTVQKWPSHTAMCRISPSIRTTHKSLNFKPGAQERDCLASPTSRATIRAEQTVFKIFTGYSTTM